MRVFILLVSALMLTGCVTAGAEPERFSGMDCRELSELSRSYSTSLSQYDLFQDSDINKLERTNSSRRNLSDIGQTREDLRPYEVQQEKDINSIRAASRLKGC